MSDGEAEVTINKYQRNASAPALLSIVSPAYREAENLPELYGRIRAVMDGLPLEWEWVILDDHSPDETFEVVRALAARDERVRGLRLARNSGSHIAVSCALNPWGVALELHAPSCGKPDTIIESIRFLFS